MTQNQKQKKQQFKNRIDLLSKTDPVRKETPEHGDEYMATLKELAHLMTLEELKKFADRNFEGTKPNWPIFIPHKMVKKMNITITNPHYNPDDKNGETMVTGRNNNPEHHQAMFDILRDFGIVPEDSTIQDYDFLFDFNTDNWPR